MVWSFCPSECEVEERKMNGYGWMSKKKWAILFGFYHGFMGHYTT